MFSQILCAAILIGVMGFSLTVSSTHFSITGTKPSDRALLWTSFNVQIFSSIKEKKHTCEIPRDRVYVSPSLTFEPMGQNLVCTLYNWRSPLLRNSYVRFCSPLIYYKFTYLLFGSKICLKLLWMYTSPCRQPYGSKPTVFNDILVRRIWFQWHFKWKSNKILMMM
jgi:hypothetical protein